MKGTKRSHICVIYFGGIEHQGQKCCRDFDRNFQGSLGQKKVEVIDEEHYAFFIIEHLKV